MIRCQLFLLKIVCAFLVSVIPCGANCPYKVCDCYGSTISCEWRGLTEVPPLISTNYIGLTELIFDGNNITRIPSSSLPSGLVSISLINNPTTTIEDTAFKGSANSLEALLFSDFRFTRIPDALLSLNKLQSLTIYEGTVLDWNVKVMTKLGQTVEILDLYALGLNTWPDWIQDFVILKSLTVASGSISFVPPGALAHLSESLASLFLDSNKLLEVPEAIFNITSLENLNLSNNSISNATWLPRRSNLTSLGLQTNRISNAEQLSNALLPFKDTLNYLYIQENLLTSVPNLTFLTQVGSLDLSSNRINNTYSGAVQPNLFSLDLGYNYLSAVPRFMSHLTSITDVRLSSNIVKSIQAEEFPPNTVTIDLDFNYITELTDTSFPESPKIKYLNLNNNPLARISPLAFKNIPLLLGLNLQSTKLTRLPQTLSFLTSLNRLDLSNCNKLVCTCLEKGLKPWVTSLFHSNVIGMCGATSVYDFFTQLSSACP
ncbi:unnamed protein product [Candidula unifasciata]|uniref:Uncharacterized protein n=1 Tax=Candidula unifasciata TaxID=100452 RepID=A0A8S3ZYZ3_9EUPU|nr:unnamed protein product [Candidula unifasciata]